MAAIYRAPGKNPVKEIWRLGDEEYVLVVSVLASLLMPAMAMAQSPFDGTWKLDMKTAKFPEKPDVYLLQDGTYHCKTCVPMVDVRADGQDQKVSGHPYYDTVSIKIVDGRTIEETDKKNGKIVTTSKTWVSADANTLMPYRIME